jgi:hypothetical protein
MKEKADKERVRDHHDKEVERQKVQENFATAESK